MRVVQAWIEGDTKHAIVQRGYLWWRKQAHIAYRRPEPSGSCWWMYAGTVLVVTHSSSLEQSLLDQWAKVSRDKAMDQVWYSATKIPRARALDQPEHENRRTR